MINQADWISVNDKLPEAPKYDWVLAQTKLVPENVYGVPVVAELRNGAWYCRGIDGPLEYEYGVEITHWMPLPEPPDGFKLCKALEVIESPIEQPIAQPISQPIKNTLANRLSKYASLKQTLLLQNHCSCIESETEQYYAEKEKA